jgi:hypothetical protein
MPCVKTIAITTGLADEMRLRRPEFEVKITEDEKFHVQCQENMGLIQTLMNVLGHQVQVIWIERRRGKSKVLIELDGLVILGVDYQGSRCNDRLSLQKPLQRIFE